MSRPKRVTKAVITAAGRGTRQFPATLAVQKEMIPLVDRDGVCKPTLHMVVEEALEAGIEQVCIVVQPGAELALRSYFRELGPEELAFYAGQPAAAAQAEALARMEKAICYALQPAQEGYGHAVYCAREFVGNQPFLLLLGDHLYVEDEGCPRCARQVLELFARWGCPVSAVAKTPGRELHRFGTVAGEPLAGRPGVWEVRALYEKPTPQYARECLRTRGLPEDTYLTFFGIHVFTPDLFDCLEEMMAQGRRERGEFQLTTAQEMLRGRRRYLAVEIRGQRLDMGVPEGLVSTQLALALRSPYAEAVRRALREGCGERCE